MKTQTIEEKTQIELLDRLTREKDELQKYFDLVCDKNDWKAPISSLCTSDEVKKVYEAILFYTGTEAKFDYLGQIKVKNDRMNVGDLFLAVRADGYRKGPAGDH